MHTNTLAYAIAGSAICVSVLLTASTLVTAARGSDDSGRTDRASHAISDDGTADQGRGDFDAVVPILSDDGTPDQGSGDAAGGTMLAGSIIEIEADVFTDTTVVKAEVNDEKMVFETTARDREALIAEIAQRLDMDTASVDALLMLEIEDRASRATDRD